MTEAESAHVAGILDQVHGAIKRHQITHQQGQQLVKQAVHKIGPAHVATYLSILPYDEGAAWLKRQSDYPLLQYLLDDDELEKLEGHERWLKSLELYVFSEASERDGRGIATLGFRQLLDALPAMAEIMEKRGADDWSEAREAAKKVGRVIAALPRARAEQKRLKEQQAALSAQQAALSEQQAALSAQQAAPAAQQAVPVAQQPDLPEGTPLDRKISAAIRDRGGVE